MHTWSYPKSFVSFHEHSILLALTISIKKLTAFDGLGRDSKSQQWSVLVFLN